MEPTNDNKEFMLVETASSIKEEPQQVDNVKSAALEEGMGSMPENKLTGNVVEEELGSADQHQPASFVFQEEEASRTREVPINDASISDIDVHGLTPGKFGIYKGMEEKEKQLQAENKVLKHENQLLKLSSSSQSEVKVAGKKIEEKPVQGKKRRQESCDKDDSADYQANLRKAAMLLLEVYCREVEEMERNQVVSECNQDLYSPD